MSWDVHHSNPRPFRGWQKSQFVSNHDKPETRRTFAGYIRSSANDPRSAKIPGRQQSHQPGRPPPAERPMGLP